MPKILIVDDEPKACEQLELFFKAKGCEVTTASSGEEALSKLKSERPHIILLDVRMPGGMDGVEVLRQAKELDPAVGAIMLTAVQEEGVFKEALEGGASDYLTKPIDLGTLESKITLKLAGRFGKEAFLPALGRPTVA